MNRQQLSHIQHIQKAQREGRLALFVGAGVSRNSGIPTWNDLIKCMKEELPNSLSEESDALKIAQMYKDARGHKEYMDKVKDVLLHDRAVPNAIHKKLLSLNPCHIITTNYDNLIEQEIKNEFALYDVIHEDRDIPRMMYPHSLIKMHGDYEADNIVLTENDYYNYSKNFPLIRALVQSIFASKTVLFIGFSFADLNLKMIMNELKNILSENMQRAYLISIDEPDELTKKYFENKGINIVYLNDNEVMSLCGCDYKDNKKNNKGLLLENILTAINSNKDLLKNDLATYLYNKIIGYSSELNSFGDGLRYLFPNYKNIMWNTHSYGLQTFSEYFRNLKDQLHTNSDKRRFLISHPEIDLRTLLRIAYFNYLGEIDSIEILDDAFNENVDSYIEATVVDHIRDFDYESAIGRISYLHSRVIDYTISDLEYPFYLYYIGKYWEAYTFYVSLLEKYWIKQKYILYFLCRYNMWAIRNAVWRQKILDKEFNPDKDLLFADENLDDILSKLPLNDEIKRLLSDVISYRQVGNRLQKTDKLREDIFAQRMSSLKGGCSINSNLTNLLALHHREKLFCYSNYIITNNNSYYSSLCYNMVLSVLNSLSTKAGYFRGVNIASTRLIRINVELLKLLIFEIQSKELKNIIDAYNITDIEISEGGIEYVKKALTVLYSSKDNIYSDEAKICAIIKNVILIILTSKDFTIDADTLYNLLVKFWSSDISLESKNIKKLIRKYPPSTSVAKLLINQMLYKSHDIPSHHDSISSLVNIIKDSNETIENVSLEELSIKNEAISVSLLYPISPLSEREKLYKYCIENIKCLYHYLFFICHNSIEINDTKKFLELYEKENTLSEAICNLMLKVRRNEKYRLLHNIIDECAENDKCLYFFLYPYQYPYLDDFDAHWVLTLYPKNDDRVKFFKQEQYREKLKDLINNNYWDDEDRKYLISLL